MNIKDRSEDELRRILGYLAPKDEGEHPPVLVGGWAVYAYNSYEKSTDIDLVLNAKRRGRLLKWLQTQHEYQRVKHERDGWQGTWKDFEAPKGDRPHRIYVDVAGYNEGNRFEGRPEHLDFGLVKNHHVERNVGDFHVNIPTRSLLLLFKAKACFDRATRIATGTSASQTYDEDKLVKDRSDILAILDSGTSGPDWEVGFLGEQLTQLPFLINVLNLVPKDGAALARYRHGHISAQDAQVRVAELLSLVT